MDEGQDVKAGDLIALLDPDELAAAKAASDAQARSLQAQIGGHAGHRRQHQRRHREHRRQRAGPPAAPPPPAWPKPRPTARTRSTLTRRTVALADQGILSAQDRDTAVQALKAAEAHEKAARDQMAAAEAAMKAAQARTSQATAARATWRRPMGQWASAQAQASEAGARLGYTRIVAPITGKVGIWAAREGEVVNPGSAIVTIVDLEQTWVYAPLPETEADAVQLGDHLKVRMPGGATVDGKVLVKSAEGDFATQRDVSRRKRDIKTVRIKLLIDNPGERYVPGMTAEVLVPKSRLARRERLFQHGPSRTRRPGGDPGREHRQALRRRSRRSRGSAWRSEAGETFGLLGPNGAGKSTLIRMMTTLIPITEGRAFIDGHDVGRRTRRGPAAAWG